MVRYNEFGFKRQFCAETIASRACAKRVVEREQTRFNLRDGEAGHRASELFRENELLCFAFFILLICKLNGSEAFGQLQCGFQRICQAASHVFAHNDTVNNDINIVFELLIQSGRIGDFIILAVNFYALEALFHELSEFFSILAFAATHDWGQQVKAGSFFQCQNAVYHLGDGLTFNWQARCRRVWNAYAREQEAHVVIDLCDCANCGAWVF